MLVYETKKCDKCKKNFVGILQYMTQTCRRCNIKFTLCNDCYTGKCLKCKGKLKTEQENLAKKGIHIMY